MQSVGIGAGEKLLSVLIGIRFGSRTFRGYEWFAARVRSKRSGRNDLSPGRKEALEGRQSCSSALPPSLTLRIARKPQESPSGAMRAAWGALPADLGFAER
jgi:hypothetical protein